MRPLAVAGFALVLIVAGCGTPPELAKRGAPVPLPSAAPTWSPRPVYPPGFTPPPTASPTASPSPSASPFPLYTAVPCGSRPSASAVISLVRRDTAIDPSRALSGPVCSGDWHYTFLEVPGSDPVQAVTKGSLTLVAAGTEVCTVEVRLHAPAGIKALAC